MWFFDMTSVETLYDLQYTCVCVSLKSHSDTHRLKSQSLFNIASFGERTDFKRLM